MKNIYLLLFLSLLLTQHSKAQGTFNFENATTFQTPSFSQIVSGVSITVSSSGLISCDDWGGWGGTSGNIVYNQNSSPSMLLSFDNTVTISSLRMAELAGEVVTYLFTPTPNTGTTTATLPLGGGITVSFGASFQNISAINITRQSGGNTYFIIDDVVLQGILPVELISITSSVSKSNVTLNWQTATETNNYGFEVERCALSAERQAWDKIGFVNGNGNSNSQKNYSYEDKNVTAGNYSYRLKQIDNDGQFEYSKTIEVDMDGVKKFELSQNYPNPFNPSTTIKFNLPEAGMVKLTLFNILGQQIRTLVNEFQESGVHTINFDATELNSGMYLYKIESNGFTQTRKMTLVK